MNNIQQLETIQTESDKHFCPEMIVYVHTYEVNKNSLHKSLCMHV